MEGAGQKLENKNFGNVKKRVFKVLGF